MKPIYIVEGGGKYPKILYAINMDTPTGLTNDTISAVYSQKVNNAATLELTISANSEAAKAITPTSDLWIFDSQGTFQEFHIVTVEDYDSNGTLKYIYAESSICELMDCVVRDESTMPTTTNPADYLNYILSYTRWEVGTVDNSIYNQAWKEDLVGKNCLEALQLLLDKYNCEFSVRYVTNGSNKITHRYIDLHKQIGRSIGKRFENNKDILDLRKTLDYSNIKTAIYPRIAKQTTDSDGNSVTEYIDISNVTWSTAAGHPCDKPKGNTVLIDPDASSLLRRLDTKSGGLHNRIMYAEWTENTCADAEDLCKQAWAILKANSVINPTIEVNAVDLYRLSGKNAGYKNELVTLGDTVNIIDRAFQPALRLETRVMEICEDLLNPVNTTIVFGSYRRTLATSNVNSKKTIEEQLTALEDKVQGVIKTTRPTIYESGVDYYTEIKERVQNDFITSSGYIMIEESDGLWVFDKPLDQHPTKATIVKGGCLAIAEYDSTTDTWEVGSFTDGLSVNADRINTGHLSSNVIAAGSIGAEHLSIAAQEYLKTGMATEDDLQGVINDITSIQNDYVTSQALSNAIDGLVGGQLSISDIKAVQDTQRQLKIEYESVYAQANKVYTDEYLGAGTTEKVTLNTKMTAYTTAYNNYYNQITSMVADGTITDAEYEVYKTNSTNYGKALKELLIAVEEANSARLKNVYAQARTGLVTEAQLEVNNTSVVATARQGMISTDDLTAEITIAKNDMSAEMTNKIDEATSDLVTTEELNAGVVMAKIPAYEEMLESITIEYNRNLSQARAMSYNPYLLGTAKNNLNTAITNYTNTYNELYSAVNSIISDVSLDTDHVNAYTTALSSYKSAAAMLGQRMSEATTNVTNNIYANSKTYTDTKTTELNEEIADVTEALTDLNTTMNSAFRDSIISEAEAKAIESNLKVLATEKADIDQEKNTLYLNPYLTGEARTELGNAKTSFNDAHTTLVNSIKSAITDKAITDAERNTINTNYTAYNTALADYRVAAQNAIDYIAEAKSNSVLLDLTLGGRNLLLNSDNGYLNDLTVFNPPASTTYANVDGWRQINLASQLNKHEIVQNKWYTPTKLGYYTFSIFCKTDATSFETKVSAYTAANAHNLLDTKITAITDDMYRIVATWEVTALDRVRIVDLRNFLTDGATYIAFRYPMLEYSKVVSDWTAAPEDLIVAATTLSQTAIDEAVKDLATFTDVETAENNAIIAANIETIKQTYSALSVEYQKNIKEVDTTLSSDYLAGTALSNLNTSKSNYMTGFNNVTNAHDDIVNKGTLTSAQLTTWNNAVTSLKTRTTVLSQRLNEARNYINTAVYNASKDYTDKAIPDALTGYAKTSYVEEAKEQAIQSAKEGMVSETQLEVNNTEILMKAASMGQYNLLYNTDFRNGLNYWTTWGTGTGKTVKILKETQSHYTGAMSGEKNLAIILDNQTSNTNVSIGAYQELTNLLAGVSYTVGYWFNCQATDVSVYVSATVMEEGTIAENILYKRDYRNINGTKDRDTWKYDSITFTVPEGTNSIRFGVSVKKVNDTWGRAFLVKPMLTTGINAQAWTANPEEIHVGVVSITEQRGIMVEHSDSNTYTTLDSTGLMVWEHGEDIPVATFADGVANINTIYADNIISDSSMPIVDVSQYHVIHCSPSGSGTFTGKDSSNCARGFTGAMEILCNKLGMDTTHCRGNFSTTGTNQIDIYVHGATQYGDILLENIYGSITLRIIFDSNTIFTGTISLNNIQCNCIIEGGRTSNNVNSGMLLKCPTTALFAKNCSSLALTGFRVFCTSNELVAGIHIENGTKARLENIDVNGFSICLYAGGQAFVSVYECRGTGSTSGTRLNTGSMGIFRGGMFTATSGIPIELRLGSEYILRDATATNSLINNIPMPINKSITASYLAARYTSSRKYTVSDLIQGSWNDADTYEDFVGTIELSSGSINVIKKGSSTTVKMYLERVATAHGSSTAKVMIDGTEVGSLGRGEGKWFTVPAATVDAISKGNTTVITLNGTGNEYYSRFKRNVKFKITTTVSM